jgi:tetratricopeptide (TPR) repeat protein
METVKISFMVALLLVGLSQHVGAQGKDSVTTGDRLSRIENTVTEVRRDQLNYELERDLLKDAFSSNFQTINVILAIVLGVFSFVSFFGMRDINSLKKQYSDELRSLNTQRLVLEKMISEYRTEQTKVKEDFVEVLKANEVQNRRIKLLELQEKVGALFQAKNYQRALEYLNPALELEPTDIHLLMQKGACLWRLADLPGAMDTYSRVLELDGNNFHTAANLVELYLITNRLTDFSALLAKHRLPIERVYGDLPVYFEALEKYQRDDTQGLRRTVDEYIQSFPSKKVKRSSWVFDDAINVLQPKDGQTKGELLLLLISAVKGETDKTDAIKKLAAIK